MTAGLTAQPVQYDLFGVVAAAEASAGEAARAASAAAVRFLTQTPWPGLLGWWLHPEAIQSKLDRGEAKACYRRTGGDGQPGWAWAVWSDGLRFEAGDTWGGWDQRPRWCVPWGELHRVRAAHPQISAELAELADGRGHPRAAGWLWWTDPYVLHPHGWHASYFDDERQPEYYQGCARPETAYRDRFTAWRLALGAVADADLAVDDKGRR